MKLNKNIFGWIMYDFANSSFTTIIVTVIFSKYFVNNVVSNGELGTALWGRSVAISMFLVAITAPVFGAIADYSRAKKKFLFYNTYLTIIFTALMYFVKEGHVIKGMIYFIIANFGFNSANVFYNSLLPDIVQKKDIGKVSGIGWGIGYLGGLLALFISLPMVKLGYIRAIFPMVAFYFSIFSIFTFLMLKEIKRDSKRTNYFRTAYNRVKNSFINIKKFKELIKFNFSYLIYNDGIVVVIGFASIFGAKEFGMTTEQLIKFFILLQPASMLGSIFFGFILDKIGAKKTIVISLFIWIAVVVLSFFCKNITQFYMIGLLSGLAIGSSQSSSRTMLALLTPKNKMTEFFGFYSLTGKISAVIGPLIYGEVARITKSQRYAILSIVVFFVVGTISLLFVNMEKGILDANNWRENDEEK